MTIFFRQRRLSGAQLALLLLAAVFALYGLLVSARP